MPSKTEEKIMDPMACLNRREGLNQTSKILICEIGHEGMVLNQILMCPILKYDLWLKLWEGIMSKLGTNQKGGIYSKYPTISKNLMGGKGLEVKHKCSRFDISESLWTHREGFRSFGTMF